MLLLWSCAEGLLKRSHWNEMQSVMYLSPLISLPEPMNLFTFHCMQRKRIQSKGICWRHAAQLTKLRKMQISQSSWLLPKWPISQVLILLSDKCCESHSKQGQCLSCNINTNHPFLNVLLCACEEPPSLCSASYLQYLHLQLPSVIQNGPTQSLRQSMRLLKMQQQIWTSLCLSWSPPQTSPPSSTTIS